MIDTRLQSTTSGKRFELNFPERDNYERGLNNYHVMEKSVRRVHHALRADTLDRSIFNVIKALVMPSNTFLEIQKFMNYLLTLRKKERFFGGSL